MIAAYFIERPVLANVIAILMLVIGGVALFALPVAQYPQMTPPTIQVTTSFPGASALTVQQQVAHVIESEVNGVDGMLYMQSFASSDGRYNMVVTFAVGTDVNKAQIAVQNRVAIATPKLPAAVQSQGVVTKKKSTAILQIVTLTSTNPAHDGLFLSNFAGLRVRDHLARVPGVSDVTVFGIGFYAMRIWLDASQMNERGLVPSDVISVINQQNQTVTARQIGAPPALPGQQLQLTVTVDQRFKDPGDFGDLIIKAASDGSLTRLKDVARIELGSSNYNQSFHLDNRPAGGIAIFQLPDANALATARLVRQEMDRLAADFPSGLGYAIPFDTTKFVDASIDEIYSTLFQAGALVLVVVIVFLQNWRSTLVPATTVPITIIGAFAAMAAFGFSINLLTLFALVLCIGIVVDDAIVVVEGVTKEIETGLAAKPAAIAAMRDLLGPIIGITLVLSSIFLPAAFIPGITGQMYRQFALVIGATAILSGINAITLKPTQSARYIRPRSPGYRPILLARAFNQGFAAIEDGYIALIGWLLRRPLEVAGAAVLIMMLAGYGFTRIPTGFLPTEDQGYLIIAVQLPDAASLERTDNSLAGLVERTRHIPGVDHIVSIGGISPLDNNASLANSALVYVILKDWKLRGKGQDLLTLFNRMTAEVAALPGFSARVLPPPPINGLGLSGGFQMQVELTDGSGDLAKLDTATKALIAAASADPRIQLAFTSFRLQALAIQTRQNTFRAESLNVSIGNSDNALQGYLGSAYVDQFSRFGQNYNVTVQADEPFRRDFAAIGRLTVRGSSGAMVPFGAFVQADPTTTPPILQQYNLMPSAAINGGVARGHASGEALNLMDQLAKRILPPGVSYEWTAMSYQERLVGGSVVLVFALSLFLVYLVLAGQYESWITPLTVLISVPLSLVGTVAVLSVVGLPNNIYVQIGLVLLIALSAKNAILIVEVAHEAHLRSVDPIVAALMASRRRFRPIVMTSLAFLLGVLPLVLAHGAGAAARISIGLTVFSGMFASTVLAVALVPVFFVVIARWQGRPSPAAAAHEPGLQLSPADHPHAGATP